MITVGNFPGSGERAIKELKREMQRELVFRTLKLKRAYRKPSEIRVAEQKEQARNAHKRRRAAREH